jgi:gluconolactonase
VFVESSWGLFDGFRLGGEGNVWTSAGEGVNCYTAQGELLGRIRIPETVSTAPSAASSAIACS